MTTIAPTADDYVLAAEVLDRAVDILNERGVMCADSPGRYDDKHLAPGFLGVLPDAPPGRNCTYHAIAEAMTELTDHNLMASFGAWLGRNGDVYGNWHAAYVLVSIPVDGISAALGDALKIVPPTPASLSAEDGARMWTITDNDVSSADRVIDAVKTAGMRARTKAIQAVELEAISELV